MINTELVNYIKSELAKGHTIEAIKVSLINAGGWNTSDLEEAFSAISHNTPIVAKRSKLIFIIPIIILLVSGSAFAGWKFYEPEIKSLLGFSVDNIETPELKSDIDTEIQIDSEKLETVASVVLLSPVNDEKVISGSTITGRYKVTGNNVKGLILLGGCIENIENKLEGEYTFECKIDDKKLGPIKALAIDINSKTSEADAEKNTINLKVVAPSNIKPVEITWTGDRGTKVDYDDPIFNDFVGMIGNDSNYIAPSIKYNDGSIRAIPFNYLKYTINDPSLISFIGLDSVNYVAHFMPNKSGKAIITLEYEGIKRYLSIDIPKNP